MTRSKDDSSLEGLINHFNPAPGMAYDLGPNPEDQDGWPGDEPSDDQEPRDPMQEPEGWEDDPDNDNEGGEGFVAFINEALADDAEPFLLFASDLLSRHTDSLEIEWAEREHNCFERAVAMADAMP